MTIDLQEMVERAEKWRDFTPLVKEDFAEEFADDLAAYVLALAEEVRHYQRALVEHHATHNLSDEVVRESLGRTCQVCARAAKKETN